MDVTASGKKLVTLEQLKMTNIGSGILLSAPTLSPIFGISPADDSDSTAIISQTSGSQEITLFDTQIDSLTLGAYSIIMRAKIADISSNQNIVKISVSSIKDSQNQLLKELYIQPDIFSKNNEWECLGFGINFIGLRGSSLKLEGKLLTEQGNNFSLDYIKIIPASIAIPGID